MTNRFCGIDSSDLLPHVAWRFWAIGICGFVLIVTGCGKAGRTEIPSTETAASELLEDVTHQWLVEFVNSPRQPERYLLPQIIGSGCAVMDFDRNGHLDILFVSEDSTENSAAFFSQELRGVFNQRATELGLEGARGTGIAVADCNNDGWPDIYIASTAGDNLWINENGRRFTNASDSCGLLNEKWGTSACWLDFDRDGWLDLFVTNYVRDESRECGRLAGGDLDFCNPGLFERTSDVLFRNVTGESLDGAVKFLDCSADLGISRGQTAGLGVSAFDANGDEWIDIYVASDQYSNQLWINQQGTRFSDEATVHGCDLDFQGRAQGSMGIALGDLSGDGRDEVIVSHLAGESHAIYSRGSSLFFRDICRDAGISSATLALTGFGVCVADFNGDGCNDLLTVNGRVKRSDGASPDDEFWEPYRQPLQLLLGNRAVTEYSDSSIFGGRRVVGRGLSMGDLDRDGDIDAVVSAIGEPSTVLRNTSKSTWRHMTLKFVDPALGGRSCPGVKFQLNNGQSVVHHFFQPCQSYMSCHADEFYLTVPALGVMTLEVVWPHGSVEPERFDVVLESEAVVAIERGRGTAVE